MTAKFDVRLEGILEFAGTSERRGERFDEVTAALEAARVGRESFGKMPASGDIHATYEERVNSTLADLKECAEAMRDIAESVRDTSQEYQNLDTGLGEVMDQIAQAMSGIAVPEVGG